MNFYRGNIGYIVHIYKKLCHVMIQYVFLSHFYHLMNEYIGNSNNKFLHVLNQYVFSIQLYSLIYSYIDHSYVELFHVLIQYVFLTHFSNLLNNYICIAIFSIKKASVKIGVKSTIFELQKSLKYKSSSLINFQINRTN